MSEALAGLLDFGLRALQVSLLLALLGGVLSVEVVLHRIVFVAAAISQVSAAGISLGLLMEWDPLVCSGVASLAAVAVLSGRLERARLSAETTLGVLFTGGAALSILFVAKSAAGHEEVMHLLEGNLLFATPQAVTRLGLLAVGIAVSHLVLTPHLVYTGFDPEGAQAAGYRVGAWRLFLYASIGAAVAAGMEYGGTLLTFADLVLPGAIGLSLTPSLGRATAIAVGVALATHATGLWISFVPAWDLPPAPTIVALLVLAYLLAALVGRLASRS